MTMRALAARRPLDPTSRPRAPGAARLRNRRGATAVVVGLLLVPMIGFAALVVDVGRWQLGANALQTAADAAALAAADRLQRDRATAPASVLATAALVASKNPAFGAPVSLAAGDVVPKFWDPTSRRLTASTWAEANAIEVTARQQARHYFGGIFGAAAPVVTRSAAVWIAKLNGTKCVKPWALPYGLMYRLATGVALDDPPSLTPQQVTALSKLSEEELTLTFLQPEPGGGQFPSNDGRWEGFNPGNTASNQEYQDALGATECRTASLDGQDQFGDTESAGTTVTSGGSKNFPKWTEAAMVALCNFSGDTDAGCHPAAGAAPGVDTKVVWGTMMGGGSKAVKFRLVGQFRVLCYYRGNAGETCPANRASRPATGYPAGTIVGLLQPISGRLLQDGDLLGNKASNVQRYFLVR